MPQKRKKSSPKKAAPKGGASSGFAWFLLALGALVVGTLIAYAKSDSANTVPLAQRRPDRGAPVVETSVTAPPRVEKVKVLNPYYSDGNLKYEETERRVKPGEDPYVAAVNAFLEASKVVPAGARVERATLTGETLALDFSKEFDTTYGTEDEQTIVNGTLESLKQFPVVKRVSFRIHGRPLETLGNLDLSEPLEIDR